MERDGLRSNLHRNAEESKRLVQEGDEQVERITKELERIARYNTYTCRANAQIERKCFVLPGRMSSG